MRAKGRPAWVLGTLLLATALLVGVLGGSVGASGFSGVLGASGSPTSSEDGFAGSALLLHGQGRSRSRSTLHARLRVIGTKPALLSVAKKVGPVPASSHVSFEVVMAPRHAGQITRLARAVSTPGNPRFGHYLSRGQFAKSFGPSSRVVGQLRAYFLSRGLKVHHELLDGLVLQVSGTASRVQRALHVRLARFRLPNGTEGVMNEDPPLLKRSLASKVLSVVGLDGLARLHGSAELRSQLEASTKPASSSSRSGSLSSGPPLALQPLALQPRALQPRALQPRALQPREQGGSVPTACSAASSVASSESSWDSDQLAQAYDLTPLWDQGDLGSGVTIGVQELQPYSPSDIAAYQSCLGTSAKVVDLTVDGGAGVGPGTGESALDIENLIGMAPSSTILVYSAPDTGTGPTDSLADMVGDDQAQILTTSWGACEPSLIGSGVMALENVLFEQAALQGQSVFAASGDDGSEDCYGQDGSTALAVDEPASEPFVTGVGGTSLSSLGDQPEVAPTQSVWNNGVASGGGAGGGGISQRWLMPPWQQGPGVVDSYSSGAPCGAPAGELCREVPDVAASANPDHGYVVFWNGHWVVLGGTSGAAPLWAGLSADVADACATTSLGFLNPRLYALAAAGDPVFDRVTVGDNDYTGTNGGLYPAGPAYDMATGLGTPVAAALAQYACGSNVASPSLKLSNPRVGATGSYSLQFTTSASGALAPGDRIGIVLASGTRLPSAAGSYSMTADGQGIPVTKVSSNPFLEGPSNSVWISLGSAIPAGTQVSLTISGVENPRSSGEKTAEVFTTTDIDPATASYVLQPGPPSLLLSTVTPMAASVQVAPASASDSTSSSSGVLKLTVTILDDFGNPVPGVEVSPALTGSGPTVSPSSATTNAAGQASFSMTSTTSTAAMVAVNLPGYGTLAAHPEVFFSDLGSLDFQEGSAQAGASTTAELSWNLPASSGTAASGTAGSAMAAGQKIVVVAPAGVSLPKGLADYSLSANGTPVALDGLLVAPTGGSTTGNKAVITLSSSIPAGAQLSLDITGFSNPPLTGTRDISVATSTQLIPTVASMETTAGVPSSSLSTISVSPASFPANGVSVATVTVTLRDAAGQPVPGQKVSIALQPTGAEVTALQGVTGPHGNAVFEVTDSSSQAISVSAVDQTDKVSLASTELLFALMVPGVTLSLSGSYSAGASTTYSLTFDPPSGSLPAGSSVTLSAPPGTTWPPNPSDYSVVNEASGAGISLQGISLSSGTGSSTNNQVTLELGASLPAGGSLGISATGVVNPATACSACRLVVSTSNGGIPVASSAYPIVPGPISTSASSVEVAASSVPAGTEATQARVVVSDANGNPVSAAVVSLQAAASSQAGAGSGSGGASSAVIEPQEAVTNADGVATFTLWDPTPQSLSLRATVSRHGSSYVLQDSPVVVFTPPASVEDALGKLTVPSTGESELSFSFDTGTSGALSGAFFGPKFASLGSQGLPGAGSTITITAPAGTSLPSQSTDYSVSDQDSAIDLVGAVGLAEVDGSTVPNQATLFLAGSGIANEDFVSVKVQGIVSSSSPGAFLVSTSSDTLPVAISGALPAPQGLIPISPVRVCDTRPGNPSSLSGPQAQCNGTNDQGDPLGPGQTRTIQVAGLADIPSDAGAVLVDIAVVDPSSFGYLTIWPTGDAMPVASSVNFSPGQTIANLDEVPVGANDTISIYNPYGTTNIVLDIEGYFLPSTQTSTPTAQVRVPTAAEQQAAAQTGLGAQAGTPTAQASLGAQTSAATSLQQPATWVRLNPTGTVPNTPLFMAGAWDPQLGGFLAFGGVGTSPVPSSNTWLFTGDTWEQLHPVGESPPGLEGAAAAYDPKLGAVVLFAGQDYYARTDGTWLYSAGSWTQVDAAATPCDGPSCTSGTVPGPRSFVSMAWDPGTDQLVAFGGLVTTTNNGLTFGRGTWVLEGSSFEDAHWVRLSPLGSPPPRAGATMAWDPTLKELVLTGGVGADGERLTDTWVWTGSTWLSMDTVAVPSTNVFGSMAPDMTTGEEVLFPGAAVPAETWVLPESTWLQESPVTSPTYRDGAMAFWDPSLGKVVLFGGATPSGQILEGMWAFDPGTATPPPPPPSTPVLLVGDSVAVTLGFGLDVAQGAYGLHIVDDALLGCGITYVNPIMYEGKRDEQPGYCNQWPETYAKEVAKVKPKVSVLLVGRWDVVNRFWNDHWTTIGHPNFDAFLRKQLLLAIKVLSADGAEVVLLTAPYFDSGACKGVCPEDQPHRVNEFNEMLYQVAQAFPGKVFVLPFGEHVDPEGHEQEYVDGIQVRDGDGIHMTVTGGEWVASWLLPKIEAIAASDGHTPSQGYWEVTSSGIVTSYGNASLLSSFNGTLALGGVADAFSIPGISGLLALSPTGVVLGKGVPSGEGCGLEADVGGLPSLPGTQVIAGVSDPSGSGCWLIGANGWVMSYGGAPQVGSLPPGVARPGTPSAIVGGCASPSGGLWLVSSSGQVFALGRAPFLGSARGMQLASPVVAMACTPHGEGYWLLTRDGRVIPFGSAHFHGDLVGSESSPKGAALPDPFPSWADSLAATPGGGGYWIATPSGAVYGFGTAVSYPPEAGATQNGWVVSLVPRG